ncbi:MAG: hypothetical protein AVDCRST_MAG68-463, partial [uncultured Gemmatimonadetes bacterium]
GTFMDGPVHPHAVDRRRGGPAVRVRRRRLRAGARGRRARAVPARAARAGPGLRGPLRAVGGGRVRHPALRRPLRPRRRGAAGQPRGGREGAAGDRGAARRRRSRPLPAAAPARARAGRRGRDAHRGGGHRGGAGAAREAGAVHRLHPQRQPPVRLPVQRVRRGLAPQLHRDLAGDRPVGPAHAAEARLGVRGVDGARPRAPRRGVDVVRQVHPLQRRRGQPARPERVGSFLGGGRLRHRRRGGLPGRRLGLQPLRLSRARRPPAPRRLQGARRGRGVPLVARDHGGAGVEPVAGRKGLQRAALSAAAVPRPLHRQRDRAGAAHHAETRGDPRRAGEGGTM